MQTNSTHTRTSNLTEVSTKELTICLAYFQKFSPDLLPRKRFVGSTHLQALNRWRGCGQSLPVPKSIRQDSQLAISIAILVQADLLQIGPQTVLLRPQAKNWLHSPPKRQYQFLWNAIQDEPRWHKTLHDLGWEFLQPIRPSALLKQVQSANTTQSTQLTVNETDNSTTEWVATLAAAFPHRLLFEILQFCAEFDGKNKLIFTSRSVADALERGYGGKQIERIFEELCGSHLEWGMQKQLKKWLTQATDYQLYEGIVVETKKNETLTEIYHQRRLRPYFLRQLSPRHALIKADGVEKVGKWLAKRGKRLHGRWHLAAHTPRDKHQYTEMAWLGVRLLQGLNELIPTEYPHPAATLTVIEEGISNQTLTELEQITQNTLKNIRLAIRGKDAFHPPYTQISPETGETIKQALQEESDLHLVYQSLGEFEPRYRQVQPLRLEERGVLAYLTAYCYRTESELVFRLDRIKKCWH